ncbi:MAG: VWA domain-containing protein [Epsilonproteobacteria bacterium]|nr:VWA domain-containing protein [Campylobacterota bacterium]
MSFVYPWVLFFIFPVLILFFYIKKKDIKIPFNEKIVIKRGDEKFRFLPLVIAFALLALSRPVMERDVSNKRDLNTLFIALDMSNSMLCEDFKPNRLEFAKGLIKRMIEDSPFKVSLIVFTTNPLMIAPPTTDKEIAKIALESIEAKYILSKGTNFENLLRFVSKFEGRKNLAVFSDGGDFEDVDGLLSLIKKGDILFFGVGVATREGALIPKGDGFLKDEKGRLVVSSLNPNFIKLSEKSGGFFNTSSYLNIFDRIDEIESKNRDREIIELFFVPLLIAFFLYLHIHTTLFEKIKFIKKFLPLLVVGSLFGDVLEEYEMKKGYEAFLKGDYKKAEEIFKDLNYLESRYALGVVRMKEGRFSDALKIFRSLKSKDRGIKAKIFLNMAYCYEKMRDYERAKEFYVKSMALNASKEAMDGLKRVVFKKNQKKMPLPFSKQKIVNKKSENLKSSKKSTGSVNRNQALLSSNSKGGKKSKNSSVVSKKSKNIPVSSKVYELINKGYIDEKNPW